MKLVTSDTHKKYWLFKFFVKTLQWNNALVREANELISVFSTFIFIYGGKKIFSRDLRIMLLSTMLLSIMLLSVMLLSIMLLSIMLLSIMSFLKLVTEKAVFFLLEQMWLHLNLPCENVKYFERKERLVNIRVLSSIANFLNFIATLSRQPVEISQDSEKKTEINVLCRTYLFINRRWGYVTSSTRTGDSWTKLSTVRSSYVCFDSDVQQLSSKTLIATRE